MNNRSQILSRVYMLTLRCTNWVEAKAIQHREIHTPALPQGAQSLFFC